MKKYFLLMIACLCACISNGESYQYPEAPTTTNEIYGYMSDANTLTIKYDENRVANSGKLPQSRSDFGWRNFEREDKKTITTVVFDASVANARPEKIEYWFYAFTNLKTIQNFGYLNTADVTSMKNMFYLCKSLTFVDVNSLNIANVTDMDGIFHSCSSLATIYCKNDWSTSSASSTDMFYACTSLVGGKGTSYSSSYVNKSYAHPDGGTANPGYFSTCLAPTDVQVSDIKTTSATISWDFSAGYQNCYVRYWTGSSAPIDIYAANMATPLTGLTPNTEYNVQVKGWCGTADGTSAWSDIVTFTTLAEATNEIYGYMNGNTLVIVYDENRSSNAGKLPATAIDNGWYDFISGGRHIKSVQFGASMASASPTSIEYWFWHFNELTNVDFTNLNTSEVTSMLGLFEGCTSLASVDVNSLDVAKVTDMGKMFMNCSSLKTIHCDNDWSKLSANGLQMFDGCTSLVGGKGTVYASGATNLYYARPDGGAEAPGYFTANTEGVESIQHSAISNQKVLRDGKLFILVGDKMYDARGIEVR